MDLIAEAFPPKPHWTAQDVPDMTGKVVAVTGYGGIGYYTIKALLDRNAKVYVLGRKESLFDAAVERLASDSPPTTRKPLFIHCDLSSIQSPVKAANELKAQEPKLDILFCNAGVMVPPTGSKTDDGYDLQWQTNVMGHWILTTNLLPILLKVSEDSNGVNKARVVHTSSSGHRFAPGKTIDWESLKVKDDGSIGNGLGNWVLYGQTDLPRHLKQSFFVRLMGWVEPLVTYPAALGALTQLYLGTAPDVKGGDYGIPWARIGKPRDDAKDEKIGKEVWEWLERECKV
ncbi:hypothetical protein QFC22_005308 [Naganishia vaughanmartiniae]|uniref:Uncharacterized protein n=1 Tax=Naganishia vaughanmartiniae TaxID=1424756 RepID=A0ACC2WUK6_9TREE|nr:hypothetical protein QFC22_005308 [Naganishia vaughanmartiniae]